MSLFVHPEVYNLEYMAFWLVRHWGTEKILIPSLVPWCFVLACFCTCPLNREAGETPYCCFCIGFGGASDV